MTSAWNPRGIFPESRAFPSRTRGRAIPYLLPTTSLPHAIASLPTLHPTNAGAARTNRKEANPA